MLIAAMFLFAGYFEKDPEISLWFTLTGTCIFIYELVRAWLTIREIKRLIAEVPKTIEKACPPHQWRYKDEGGMICGLCNKTPGDISTGYDKPY